MHLRTDHDLMQDFIKGDQEAYAILVARHAGLVRCACRRQAPAADQDDCVQAVFLVLARRPRAAARAPALEAWLLRVVWYVCQRARRRQRRQLRVETTAVLTNNGGDRTPPEALDHLDDCLAKLPERQRLAVSLHYLGEKSADEVARVLGVSRDNAYQLVSRGVAGLRTLMSQRGIILGEAALALLLANEAKAAIAGTNTASLTTTLAGTPSANSLSLSQGTSFAMTLSALAPTGIAAAFILPFAIAALTLNGKPAPTPVSIPVVTTAPTPATGLDALIDIHYDQTPLEKVCTHLSRVSGVNLILDRRLVAQRQILVTLKAHQIPVREVLTKLANVSGGVVQSVAGANFLCTPERLRETRPRLVLTGMEEEQRKRLFDPQGRPVDVNDGSLDKILPWLQRASSINLRPLLDQQQQQPINLTVRNMTVADILYWIAVQSDAAVVWDHQVLALIPYEIQGESRLDPRRCDWTGIEKIPGLPKRLAQEVTLEISDKEVDQVLNWIGRVAGVEVSLIPDFTAPMKPVSLKMEKVRVDNVLYWIADQVGGKVQVSGNSLLLVVHPAHS